MNQKNSNDKKFKSITTGQPCNAAQYIAEMVCLRRAERENKGSLAYKFWNKGEAYQTQVRVAHKLIKKYGEKAILHYLNSPSGSNVYSLGFLHKSKKFVLPLELEGEFKPKKSQPNKKSLVSKLRKADGRN